LDDLPSLTARISYLPLLLNPCNPIAGKAECNIRITKYGIQTLIDATLVLLIKGQPPAELLLGYKKTGFGRGKYAGFGGKVKACETIPQAAVRELGEEAGIFLSAEVLTAVAVLAFHFPHKPSWEQKVHVFKVDQWDGSPIESQEMRPQWFRIEDIPYDRMWDDGRYWLPKILAGERFRANFIFQADNATVADLEFTPLTP
jgi:8-oxo-dGTP pyrophosphatase MutT (NUDIX family)